MKRCTGEQGQKLIGLDGETEILSISIPQLCKEDIFKENEEEEDYGALQFIPILITSQDNVELLEEIQENEVKNAIFSLGAHKARVLTV